MLRITDIFRYTGLFSIVAVLAIGSYYDIRLGFGPINITIITSTLFVFYFLSKWPLILKSEYSGRILMIFLFIFVVNFVLWFISGLNSHENYSLNKFFDLFCLILPVGLVLSTYKSDQEIKRFLIIFSFVGVLLMLLGLLSINSISSEDGRLAVLGGGPIVFSRWVGSAIIIIIFLYPTSIKTKAILVSLGFVVMAFSGSRGPLFFLIISLIIVNVYQIKFYYLFGALIFFTFFFQNEIVDFISEQRTLSRLFGLADASSLLEGTSAIARQNLMFDSFKTIINNPFGYGLGNFSTFSDFSQIHGKSGYPHNILLELAIELGFIVFGLFTIICLHIIRMYRSVSIRGIIKNSINKPLFCLWIYFLMNALVSGDLSDARYLIIFSIILMQSLSIVKKEFYS